MLITKFIKQKELVSCILGLIATYKTKRLPIDYCYIEFFSLSFSTFMLAFVRRHQHITIFVGLNPIAKSLSRRIGFYCMNFDLKKQNNLNCTQSLQVRKSSCDITIILQTCQVATIVAAYWTRLGISHLFMAPCYHKARWCPFCPL